MLVRKLKMLPVECVVRGYITGSGWKDYQRNGTVSGIELPSGRPNQPASGADLHPVDQGRGRPRRGHRLRRDGGLIGDRELADRLREVSIAVYSAEPSTRASTDHLGHTKFEFGLDEDGQLTLGDEVCTPDSSRFWPADQYEPGRSQPSFDKQFVRDWASSTGWDRNPPAPPIPDEVVQRTRGKYIEAYERITGDPFDAWLQRTR